MEVDHIKPLHQGGAPYDLDNLQVLTRPEHIKKTAKENRTPDTESKSKWRGLVNELSCGKTTN